MLSPAQADRYSRHLMLDEVGERGQLKLFQGKVLIAGAGGLGSAAALYLAAAGVGTIGLADYGRVELSDLQRQVIHHTGDLGTEKVVSARQKLLAINPELEVIAHPFCLQADNVARVIADYDFIIEATDNYETKYLVNDACVVLRKPFSYGGVREFLGEAMTVQPGSACYRCLFPEPPEPEPLSESSGEGILGVVPGVIGTILATEAIKFLLGIGNLLTDRVLIYDALAAGFKEEEVESHGECPCRFWPRMG